MVLSSSKRAPVEEALVASVEGMGVKAAFAIVVMAPSMFGNMKSITPLLFRDGFVAVAKWFRVPDAGNARTRKVKRGQRGEGVVFLPFKHSGLRSS